MVEPRPPVTTVGEVDDYCNHYQDLFADVRNFEAFKFLVLGMISEMPRKSLPAIACSVGLPNAQSLHHFLQRTPWQVEQCANATVRADKTVDWRTFHHLMY